MDYFSELLESYSKLKKRTFKLTYINEQEGGLVNQEAEKLVRQYIGNAPEVENASEASLASIPTVTGLDGAPTKYKIFNNLSSGKIGVFPFGRGITILVNKGGAEDSENIRKFASALAGEDKPSKKEAAAIDSANATADAIKKEEEAKAIPGAAIVSIGADDATIANLKTEAQYIQDMLSSEWFKLDKNLSQMFTPESIASYTAANSPESFEYKLTNGLALVDDGQGNLIEGNLKPSLLHAVTESNKVLMSLLTDDIDDNICESIMDSVGYYNSESDSRIVIFGSTNTEGVVIKPNALQKLALERLKSNKRCSESGTALEVVRSGVVENKHLNDLKGKFSEQVLKFVINFKSPNVETKIQAQKDLQQFINSRIGQLAKFARFVESRGNIATDIELSDKNEGYSQFLGLIQDRTSPQFKQLLRSTIASMLKVYQLAKPDYVEHVGSEVYSGVNADTGKKADNMFVWKDKLSAEAFASKFGVKAHPVVDHINGGLIYKVAVSQKFSEKIEEGKPGEIGSLGSLTENFTGANPKSEEINNLVGSQLFSDSLEEKQCLQYFNDLEQKVQKVRLSLTEDQAFITAEGKIKNQTAKASCEQVAKLFREKLGYSLNDKELKNLLLDKKTGRVRDFEQDQFRQRLSEYVSRRERMRILQKDLQDPQKKQMALKTIAKIASYCGYSKDNAATIHTDELGNVIGYNTNSLFTSLFSSIKDDKFDPTKQLGFTASQISFKTDEGDFVLKFEGTDAGVRDTKFSVKVKADTIKKMNKLGTSIRGRTKKNITAESIQTDTLYQFLHGQMKLLETLLSKPRVNPLH